MINEWKIYGTENSLFSQVALNNIGISTYHVSPDYGRDLNTDNLQQYLQDPKYGIKDYADDKYPMCVCMTPKSRFLTITKGGEIFQFNLFFIRRSFVSDIDTEINQSRINVYVDWSDMKDIAMKFLSGLVNTFPAYRDDATPHQTIIAFSNDPIDVRRLSNFTVDNVSGVSLNFNVAMAMKIC